MNLSRLIEKTVLILDEPEDNWWLTLAEQLSLIDFTAVLAIIITNYDQAKQIVLKEAAFEIIPEPTDSEDETIRIRLLRALILEPELYLEMIHKKHGNKPIDELEAFAKSLLKSKESRAAMNGRAINKAVNRTGRYP